jgi:tetratricopeptide (TPR) repeat protein
MIDSEYDKYHIIDYYESGEHVRCLELCQEMILNNIEIDLAYNYSAICLFKLQRYVEAIKIYSNLILSKPNFSHYVFRGDCYYKLGQFDKALADFIEALRLEPKTGSTWQRVGETYFMMADFEEAHVNIDRAIQMSNYHRDPWAIKAIFLKLQGRTVEAFNMMTEIKKKYPGDNLIRSQQFEILYNEFNSNAKKAKQANEDT